MVVGGGGVLLSTVVVGEGLWEGGGREAHPPTESHSVEHICLACLWPIKQPFDKYGSIDE